MAEPWEQSLQAFMAALGFDPEGRDPRLIYIQHPTSGQYIFTRNIDTGELREIDPMQGQLRQASSQYEESGSSPKSGRPPGRGNTPPSASPHNGSFATRETLEPQALSEHYQQDEANQVWPFSEIPWKSGKQGVSDALDFRARAGTRFDDQALAEGSSVQSFLSMLESHARRRQQIREDMAWSARRLMGLPAPEWEKSRN